MTDLELIELCYHKILRREPDETGKAGLLNALASNEITREEIMIMFLTCDEFEHITRCQEFVLPGHFYSAVPSIEEREAFVLSDDLVEDVHGLNLNVSAQIELLMKFKKYYDQCPFPDHKRDEFRYYFVNQAYSYDDALTLYGMIREYEPKRIFEIGSGYSSCVMLDTSEYYLDNQMELTFIEPYPELLYSLLKYADKERHTIIPRRVQDIDINLFGRLEANDILFVDSTHVTKLNSDVNRIVFDILPSLQKGVLVHFHDIFWPFEYPKEWVRQGRAWNEIYILRAFLELNDSFEIIFFSSYLQKYQSNWLMENMPLYTKNQGGNLWIRKVK
jgi:predicted O-methyltransferase YrrM